MKLKLYTLLIALSASLFISCGNDEKSTQPKQTAIAVSVNSPSEVQGSTLSLSGKIEAVNNAKLSTRMMGYIDKITVKIGDEVKKGQLLVSINNADLQARLSQVNAKIAEAQAAFNNAEKDYKRFKNLFEENSASRKELDDVTANYEMAKAQLESARQMKNEVQAQFAYVNIRAPFNGVITNKFAEEGDMANPGMPLLAIESPGAFEVRATVPESEVSSIKEGTEVAINVKSIDKTLKGVISEVSASAKNTGSQYPVKISLEDTGDEIRSGMYVSVDIPVKQETASEKVLIPSEALVYRGELTGLYTISSQNTALLRWVRLGKTYGDQVEVLSGLTADEQYIIDAKGKIYNGAPVSIQ